MSHIYQPRSSVGDPMHNLDNNAQFCLSGNNRPLTEAHNTTPTFKVVKEIGKTVVYVLDISISMAKENKDGVSILTYLCARVCACVRACVVYVNVCECVCG